METILAGLLILLTLLVAGGLWLLTGRLRAIDERLRDLGALALLPEKLKALSERMEDLDTDALAMEVDRLRDDVERIESLATAPGTGHAREVSRAERIRAAITRYLRDEGYRSVHVLAEEEQLESNPDEVVVEAVRQGLQVKGKVQLVGGEVAETRLDPSYSMFP